jgi:hypothetical protein
MASEEYLLSIRSHLDDKASFWNIPLKILQTFFHHQLENSTAQA